MDDNSSVTAAFNSTVALKTTSARETVAMATTATVVGLVVGIVGSSANGIVLTVLVRARRQFGSSVHSLLTNQSAMDLFACFFAMINIVVKLTHGMRYDDEQILEAVLCVLFGGGALTATSMTAEKIGLVVITVERYFKIDKAVAHRIPGFFQRCGLETIILVSRPQMFGLGLRLERRSPGGLGCCGLGLGLGLVLGLEHCGLGLEGRRLGLESIGCGHGLNRGLGFEHRGLDLGLGLEHRPLALGLGLKRIGCGLGLNHGLCLEHRGLALGLGLNLECRSLSLGLNLECHGLGLGLGLERIGLDLGLRCSLALDLGLGFEHRGLALGLSLESIGGGLCLNHGLGLELRDLALGLGLDLECRGLSLGFEGRYVDPVVLKIVVLVSVLIPLD